MAIKVRRGLKEEFIPAKLLPGEFAVTTDTGTAWYCYSAGKVIQIATSEDISTLRQESNNAQNSLQLLLDSKIDDAYIKNGYLYMTSNNEVVVGPLGPFSGAGGGTKIYIQATAPVGITDGTVWISTEYEVENGN